MSDCRAFLPFTENSGRVRAGHSRENGSFSPISALFWGLIAGLSLEHALRRAFLLVTALRLAASQAASAGSIPVTRSRGERWGDLRGCGVWGCGGWVQK